VLDVEIAVVCGKLVFVGGEAMLLQQRTMNLLED